VPSVADSGLLVQRVVYAGLDALRAVMPLDLCAYVHVATGFGPQLYLRAPDLSSMDANEAFTLFTALQTTLDAEPPPDDAVQIGPYSAVAVISGGPASRGLTVVGRREAGLEPQEQVTAVELCRAVGAACHVIEEAGPEIEPPSIQLSVHVGLTDAQAEVTVRRGGEVREGHGEASSPTAAVALATLDAVAASCKLVQAMDDEIGGERAMLVLVRDDHGAAALGSALCTDDALQATAQATLDATARLAGQRASAR
jgi:hypothetical protein